MDKITKCCTDFVINILESLEIEEEIKKGQIRKRILM